MCALRMRAWLPCIYAVYRSKKAGGACAGGLFPSRKYSERISAIALQLQFSHKIYATWCCLKWWIRAAHIATLVWLSAVGSDRIRSSSLSSSFNRQWSDIYGTFVAESDTNSKSWDVCVAMRFIFFSQCTSSADKQKSLKISLLIIIFGA